MSTTTAPTTIIIPNTPPPPDDHKAMFNVDQFLVDKVVDYHRRFNFRCAVETGTFEGNTTVGLAKLFPQVYTIEINERFFHAVTPRLNKYPNITQLLGRSPEQLTTILNQLSFPLFAFLDAHWHEDWPLREELAILLAIKQPKLIMIHDFKVPGRNFGYDAYLGNECSLDYIGGLLPHNECTYTFNHQTSPVSANRGVLFIEHLLR